MYKIALLFYGHLRSFKSTFPYLEANVLKANSDCEMDIFIHTWDELEHPTPRRHYKKDLEIAGKKIQEADIDFIKERYQPISLKITPQIDFTEVQKQQILANGFKPENYYAILNVSYSMQQVCRLMQESLKDYDFVILTRFDIIFYQRLNLTQALDARKNGIKYVQFSLEDFNRSIFYAYMEKDLYPELLRNQRNYITGIDLFCAGSSQAMQKILQWHNEILSLPPMGIEYWLTKKVVDNNLVPQIIYYDKPRCFHILRINNTSFKLAGGAFLMKEQIASQKNLWNWNGVRNLYETSLLNDKNLIFEYLSFCLETGQLDTAFSYLDKFGEITLKNLIYKDSSLKEFGEYYFGLHKQFQFAITQLDMQNLENHLIFLSHHQCMVPLIKILREQNVLLGISPKNTFVVINFAINTLIKADSLEVDLGFKLLEYISKIPLDNTLSKQYFISQIIDYFYHQANKEFFSKKPLLSLGSLVHLVSNGEAGSRILTNRIYEMQKALYPLSLQESKKPRIAILIAGQVRGEYKILFEKLKEEVIEPLGADCFLVSWTTRLKEQPIALSNSGWIHCLKSSVRPLAPIELRGTNNKFLKENFPLTYQKLSFAQKVDFEIDRQDIKTLHLIDYALEDEAKWQENMNLSGNGLKMKRIFYSIYRAFMLMSQYEMKQNFTYDYVIKIRPDILYSRIAILREKLHLLQHNEVFVDFFEYGIQDQFFAGRREAIAKVVEIYHQFGVEDRNCFERLFPKDIPLAHSSHHFLYWWYAQNSLYARRSPVGRIFNANQEVAKAGLPNVDYELAEDFKNLKEPYRNRKDFYDFFELVFGIKLSIPPEAKYPQSEREVVATPNQLKKYDSFEKASAIHRIHSHLAYKLGSAMILNARSVLGWVRIPYVLSYIKESHREEQRKYQERVAKNPSLKLPKLESYPDYKEALKEKQCFTYKLGEALMQADKDWFKGGYLRFCFKEVPKLRKEFREKKKK